MTDIPSIDALPDAPLRNDPAFSTKSAAWVLALVTFVTQLNAFAAALVAAAQEVIAGVASLNGQTGIITGFTENTATQTLTNKTLTDPVITGAIKEDIYAITDGAGFEIDPGNGTIQTITLGANRTPLATNFAAGESVTLMVADGTAYAITWSSVGVTWVGGSAPALPTSGYGVIELWKVGSTIYGSYVGPVA